MKHQLLFLITFLICLFFCLTNTYAQEQLTKAAIIEDLNFLDQQLQERSSYQGLNGYDYQKNFENYIENLNEKPISKTDFGLFLTKVIGQIGDRHAYVKEYNLPDERFLPFIVAPFDKGVLVLDYDRKEKHFNIKYPNYPYLTAINGQSIKTILAKICPEEILAPKAAYFFRAVQQLRNIEEAFAMFDEDLPQLCSFTLSGEQGDTTLTLPLLNRENRYPRWYDQFVYRAKTGEELNDPEVAQNHFQFEEDIAYIRIPDMVSPYEAPKFYDALHEFMPTTKSSKALIIDVRGNGGGTRHLIMELGKYLVHPDSISIVNVVQQRAQLPLNENRKEDLHNRFAYALNELDPREQASIQQFRKTFHPMYQLSNDRFSQPHFMLLNGQKLRTEKNYFYYDQPVYVLADERSFSAASVLATTLRCLPNVQLVGVTTDGSSGNSEKFYLPNSTLRVKLSTMVSFQTGGRILDTYGTRPDIEIKRNLDQILWKEDGQLEDLKNMIRVNN